MVCRLHQKVPDHSYDLVVIGQCHNYRPILKICLMANNANSPFIFDF